MAQYWNKIIYSYVLIALGAFLLTAESFWYTEVPFQLTHGLLLFFTTLSAYHLYYLSTDKNGYHRKVVIISGLASLGLVPLAANLQIGTLLGIGLLSALYIWFPKNKYPVMKLVLLSIIWTASTLFLFQDLRAFSWIFVIYRWALIFNISYLFYCKDDIASVAHHHKLIALVLSTLQLGSAIQIFLNEHWQHGIAYIFISLYLYGMGRILLRSPKPKIFYLTYIDLIIVIQPIFVWIIFHLKDANQ